MTGNVCEAAFSGFKKVAPDYVAIVAVTNKTDKITAP